MNRPNGLVWGVLIVAIGGALGAAAFSPQLAWRSGIYIAAGFAGIVGLALLLVQPVLIGGYLSGVSPYRGRRVHRWVGVALVSAIVVHVAGLWVTSPPDVIDALTFTSPTPFSVWGVVAMWAVFATALLAALRHRLALKTATWRVAHTALGVVIVVGTVVHALLIEGTMETATKVVLCALAVLATGTVILDLRARRTRVR